MRTVVAMVNGLIVRDEGQDLIEYALLVVLISIIALAGATTIGITLNGLFWATFANVI